MMTKGPLYKQIIIPMGSNNSRKFMILSGKHITNLNCCYDSMLKVLSKELTLVLSDTRELDRVPNTK